VRQEKAFSTCKFHDHVLSLKDLATYSPCLTFREKLTASSSLQYREPNERNVIGSSMAINFHLS